jgi:hypothetical protein
VTVPCSVVCPDRTIAGPVCDDDDDDVDSFVIVVSLGILLNFLVLLRPCDQLRDEENDQRATYYHH